MPGVILVATRSSKWVPGWMNLLAVVFGHGSSTVNVFIYGLTNSNFRAAYTRLLWCQSRKIVRIVYEH